MLKDIGKFVTGFSLLAMIGIGAGDLLDKVTTKYLPNYKTTFKGFYRGMEAIAGRSGIDGKKYIWLQDKTNNLTINAHDWYFEGNFGNVSAYGDLDKFVGYTQTKDNFKEWNKILHEKLDLAYENIVVEPDPTIF